jgi:hypothetical protein
MPLDARPAGGSNRSIANGRASAAALGLAIAAILTGCSPAMTPLNLLPLVIYPLPTVDPLTTICAPVGAGSLVLHGAVEGGAVRTWANDNATVYWPPGFTAEFSPTLVVRDSAGAIRGREGDDMTSARPWNGLYVCPEAGGIVEVSVPRPSAS